MPKETSESVRASYISNIFIDLPICSKKKLVKPWKTQLPPIKTKHFPQRPSGTTSLAAVPETWRGHPRRDGPSD